MDHRMMPAEVKRMVNYKLLGLPFHSQAHARVTPKDQRGRKCAAWCASYYEVFAFPISMSADLEPIAGVLRKLPGASDIRFRTAAEATGLLRPGVFCRLPVTGQEVA
jgi:hypothetical protein